ncbi:phosphoglycerate mutase-like protein 4 [Scenedesmus sp. PABB004]|nr:phosphoglycerate mutase-like protein 4 [Scenedesmus sp. PABB004]
MRAGAAVAELVLVRHGETDWNVERRLQGQQAPGPPLNALGRGQAGVVAAELARRFAGGVDAVWSSDLRRAVETAEPIAAALGVAVQTHAGLRERHLGDLQGLTYAEAPSAQPAAWEALQAPGGAARILGGGESLDDLRARLRATLLHIAAAHPGGRVVVVSHGGALHAAHAVARGAAAKGKVVNASISVLLAAAGPPPAVLCRRCRALEQAQRRPERQPPGTGGDGCSCADVRTDGAGRGGGGSISIAADCTAASAGGAAVPGEHGRPARDFALLCWNDAKHLANAGALGAGDAFGGSACEA